MAKSAESRGHGPVTGVMELMPGERVPKGGSSCSNCKYLADDNKSCTNTHFVLWNKSNEIPGPIDSYCSIWWERK